MLHRMIVLFRENTHRLMHDIREALAHRELAQTRRAAHALLSSLGIFGAATAYQLTQSLQAASDDLTWEHHRRVSAALECEIAEICNEFTRFTLA
jgi:HPt (histidine-containing phosphotransfer) domain-containing protein